MGLEDLANDLTKDEIQIISLNNSGTEQELVKEVHSLDETFSQSEHQDKKQEYEINEDTQYEDKVESSSQSGSNLKQLEEGDNLTVKEDVLEGLNSSLQDKEVLPSNS